METRCKKGDKVYGLKPVSKWSEIAAGEGQGER
jgi:hypothetical protein